MTDLMFYNVEYAGAEPRYRVVHEGRRLIDAYGITGIGRHLQDTVSAPVWAYRCWRDGRWSRTWIGVRSPVCA